ncbi:MAG TPA: shikimate dehydrogenase [Allosphingosinicella sp.]|nr:shikimate dehydrogenase [Allosphingosinicella sp.]
MGVPYAEVIGDPIAQSKSPLIHKFWLEQLGLEGDYRATLVPVGGLPAYLAARRSDPDWRGCNITMPHKEAAIPLVDMIEGQLGRIGALNTIVPLPLNNQLLGTNTDTTGMLEALIAAKASGPGVAVVGAGGAARAVCLALSAYVPKIIVLNRDLNRAEAMIAALGIEAEARSLEAPLPPVGLLVNASALGMTGFPPFRLSLDPLPAGAAVIDIVTSPLETELLGAARARGLRTVDGLVMLIGQAATAFHMFFGKPPPREDDTALRALLTS